jgi:hypothetical protein
MDFAMQILKRCKAKGNTGGGKIKMLLNVVVKPALAFHGCVCCVTHFYVHFP